MTDLEASVVARLGELGINFSRHEHPAVATVEEARQHCLQLTVLGSYPRATEVL